MSNFFKFIMINDEEKQQIVKFKKLEHFCFKYHV